MLRLITLCLFTFIFFGCDWQLEDKVLFEDLPVFTVTSSIKGGSQVEFQINFSKIPKPASIVEYGICYTRRNGLPTVSDTVIKGTVYPPIAGTTYPLSLTGLVPNQNNKVRAYVRLNRAEPIYGELLTVKPVPAWSKINSFSGPSRYGAISFVVNNRAYIAGGQFAVNPQTEDYLDYNDLWEFDPENNGSWRQRQSMNQNVKGKNGIGFYYNSKGYFFGFVENRKDPSPDFIHSKLLIYSPQDNIWAGAADTTNAPRITTAAVCVLGDKAYIGTGVIENAVPYDKMAVLNLSTSRWETPLAVPADLVGRQQMFAFSQNGKCYFGGGSDRKKEIQGLESTGYTLWELDPAKIGGQPWAQKADVPVKQVFERAATIGSRAFIVSSVADVFEYRNGQWYTVTEGNASNNSLIEVIRFAPVFFAIGEQLYFGLGHNDNKTLYTIKP